MFIHLLNFLDETLVLEILIHESGLGLGFKYISMILKGSDQTLNFVESPFIIVSDVICMYLSPELNPARARARARGLGLGVGLSSNLHRHPALAPPRPQECLGDRYSIV